jgi:hypothetical protein
VAKALVEQRGAILVGSHHSTPDEHPEYEISNDWVVCSGVRNHWDAMVSWWFKIERKGRMRPLVEFLPRFCENNPGFVQGNKLWRKNMPFTNEVLRYNWLESDLDNALVAVGLPPVTLLPITDSRRGKRPYQVFYKDDTARWVAQYFEEEIKKYGYKF